MVLPRQVDPFLSELSTTVLGVFVWLICYNFNSFTFSRLFIAMFSYHIKLTNLVL